ncbi:lantibiotic immunity ABC transporter MutG family permease subunit [Acetobacterium woodii]|uniref:Antibiotic ABC transport system permease protein n=1 Tax=Acetobacterium woodii (strain ATCC 29683 / DSM 1030 / JCM 2381 / KCTC 1655 / WB1) TaxID=931626 RepID=H6LFL9_ACEWD|nr:lantibiotic immunity ABC transporter MutG family permease subunit [Acetobacterium woodii]AFA46964.1 antibiotic ABC transport system permease protein [Acetobacterium woodii DSM 1030]
MAMLWRSFRSDFLKFKRTSIGWIHIVIPVVVASLFLFYYAVSAWEPMAKLSGFLEVISIGFPLMIGLICGIAVDQEWQAGGAQVMLRETKSRAIAYSSKFLLLFLMGAFSVMVTVGIFAIGFKTVPLLFYVKTVGILMVANSFLYILHLLVSFLYGKGASIGLGIGESLISALALTGLGDGRWYYLPCAWSVRLNDYLVYIWDQPASATIGKIEIVRGLVIALVVAGIGFWVSLRWFKKWDGRKSFE